jgi:N-acetylneuraminate synthase
MKPCIEIAGRRIGPGQPVYVVGKLSANHLHDFSRAETILRAAVEAGADAVKLQTYTPDTLTIACDRPASRIRGGTPWDNTSLYELYQSAYMPWEWQPKLKEIAEALAVPLFSSAFDVTSVEFLSRMGVLAFKVASFEAVDIKLIEAIAKTGKPVLISTGMAEAEEIEEVLRAAKRGGATEIGLFRCNSAYPAPMAGMNLCTIPDMQRRFGVPVGLSDHTIGATAAIAAVAMGASLIEKHITLSRTDGGPDAAFFAEPAEFKAMVQAIRDTEQGLGGVQYGLTADQRKSAMFRRSLWVTEDVRKGDVFTAHNVRSIRPAGGLHTRHLGEILGRRAAHDIERGTPLDCALVEGGAQQASSAQAAPEPASR